MSKKSDFTTAWGVEQDPDGASDEIIRLRADLATAERLLKNVTDQILDYERVSNLAPNPGRKYCWDSVADARAFLSRSTSNAR